MKSVNPPLYTFGARVIAFGRMKMNYRRSLIFELTIEINVMKKSFIAVAATLVFLSSCEIEYRGGLRYYHPWGWEHRHYPGHHEVYNHGYHHDEHGNEIRHD